MNLRQLVLCSILSLGLPLFALTQTALDMTLLGHWDVDTLPTRSGFQYNDIWGYSDCNGNEYAIMGSPLYIHFIALDEGPEPVEVAHFAGFSTTVWRDMKTYKDRAYAVSDNNADGLMVFDLSQLPDTVIRTNFTQEFFSRSHNIFIDEQHGRLYAVGTNTTGNGVIIFDLTENPDEPQVLSNTPLPGGYVHDIYVRDNIGYCSHGNSGLSVYDFTDPANPILLGSISNYPESGYNHSSWLDPDGEYLVFADESFGRSLKMTDVRDLGNMEITDLFKSTLLAPDFTNSIAHNPFIRDNYVIISYYHEGIQIYDLTDPENVANVAYYDTEPDNVNYNGFTGAWGAYPYLPSGRILGSDTHHGLFVLSADSIEFNPIEGVRYPEISLDETETIQICEGESVSITALTEAEEVRWFQDEDYFEDGETLTIDETGTYFVEARNGHCTTKSIEINVEVTAYPDLQIITDRDIACEGEAIQVQIESNADQVVYFDEEGVSQFAPTQFEVNQPINLVFYASTNDCETISEGFSFEFVAPPSTDWWPAEQFEICSNETLELDIPNVDENLYLIKDGDLENITTIESNLLTLENGGNYQIQAENEVCYSISESLDLAVIQAVIPFLFYSETTEELVASPAPFYQWYKDGVVIPKAKFYKYRPTTSGVYTVETRDFNGCYAISNEVEITVGGNIQALSGNVQSGIAVYPNPTKDIISISGLNNETTNYQILNQQGQLIQEGILNDRSEINLGKLPAGIYWISLNGNKNVWTEKVVLLP